MKVVEKFTSINGEGTRAGELAVFIRFKGCNLRCSYCDTMWANEPECPYKEETPEEILNYVLRNRNSQCDTYRRRTAAAKRYQGSHPSSFTSGTARLKLRQMEQSIWLHFVKSVRYLRWTISCHQAGAKTI